jgi:hypothetical protein
LPGSEILLPPMMEERGAIGAALLAQEKVGQGPTAFLGWHGGNFAIRQTVCHGCSNQCDIFHLAQDGAQFSHWGGRCERQQLAAAAGDAKQGSPALRDSRCGPCGS